ncbi:hypothetical protein [Ruegeria sp.]|uniref:hypothetical protein n=1 Tax=Ruegeria sp. TaxID=1879320 RepID=UPI003B00F85E
MRLDAVAASERLIATGIARADADARAAREAGVTGDTVRRWRLTCQGLAPEARLVVLTDRPGAGAAGRSVTRRCATAPLR